MMLLEAEARQKLAIKTEKKQLEVYHQIENWGCTLFLTGILLIAKQEMDWRFEHAEAWAGLGCWISPAPAVVGLYGYLLLLVVNYRSRAIRKEFFGALERKARGTLGWLLALLPVLSGLCASFAVGGIISLTWLAFLAFLAITVGAYRLDHPKAGDDKRNLVEKTAEQFRDMARSVGTWIIHN